MTVAGQVQSSVQPSQPCLTAAGQVQSSVQYSQPCLTVAGQVQSSVQPSQPCLTAALRSAKYWCCIASSAPILRWGLHTNKLCTTSTHTNYINAHQQTLYITDIPTRSGGITVRTRDLWSRRRGFNSRSGRCQLVTNWMGDCLRTSEPSQYITNHPGKLSLPSLRGRQIDRFSPVFSPVNRPGLTWPGVERVQLPASTVTSVGNGIGPGSSAWRWHRYALVIPHCWRLTFTISGAGTRPSARTATAPKRRSSIWCSSVRPMITPGGTPGQETPSQPIRDASVATWNGLGRWPPPDREWERERGQCEPNTAHQGFVTMLSVNCNLQNWNAVTSVDNALNLALCHGFFLILPTRSRRLWELWLMVALQIYR